MNAALQSSLSFDLFTVKKYSDPKLLNGIVCVYKLIYLCMWWLTFVIFIIITFKFVVYNYNQMMRHWDDLFILYYQKYTGKKIITLQFQKNK